jgi:hypothetical protein
MPKYGRGMKIEILDAIKKGKLKQPVTTKDIEEYMNINGWYPKKNFVNVFLPNHTNPNHSKTYEKIFQSIGDGKYLLIEELER